MSIGSLFSGIDGLGMGLEMAGLGPVLWQVEADPFCRAILSRHWPDATRHKYVQYVGKHNLSPVSLLIGGFPCQDISSAGAGVGLTGQRSGLWYEFARIVGELRPPWVVVENVTSGAGKWVDFVRSDLENIGYETLPVPMSARDVGAPHKRARIFIIAYTERHSLWDGAERLPGRWLGRVRPEGEAKPEHDGDEGDAPNPDGEGLGDHRTGGRETEHGPASLSGATPADSDSQREPAQPGLGEVASSSEAPGDGGGLRGESLATVRRMDDGFSGWVDGNPVPPTVPVSEPNRIRALGNSVVPQCAEVIGWMIRELQSRMEEEKVRP